MSRIGVVLNPAGGRGRTLATWKEVEATLNHAGEVSLAQTDRPGHGTELARGFAEQGFDLVVAIGGDGTINEVANGLVLTSTTLGIIPSGTANDLVKTLAIPCDPLQATEVILSGKRLQIDVGEAVGHRYFFNIAGLGFDAEVIREMESQSSRVKSLGPTIRYWMAILRTFGKFSGVGVQLLVDGVETRRDRLLLLAVGPAKFYGSGMKMLPNASFTDGLIDYAGGQDLSWFELIKLLKKIYKGTHLDHRKTFHGQAREISVTGPATTHFHLDGDLAGCLPVTFRSVPSALAVVIPKQS